MTDVADQYGSLIYQLVHLAETLRLHGNALFEMGPLAPPCLVRPYNEYRQKVLNAAVVLDSALRDGGLIPPELAPVLSRGVASLLPHMPELIGSYSDAPPEWQPDAYDAPSRPPLGRLGQSELTNYLRDVMIRRPIGGGAPAVVSSVEAVGGHWFWRGARYMGGGLMRWASRWCVPLMIFEARGWLGSPKELFDLMHQIERPASSSVASAVNSVLDAFESDYWPRVAQQWQAMIRIYRASMGRPDTVRSMMAAWD
ncbi:MAG: hypothetical protein JXB32_15915, partial [Deltaproteobacteria bacterium]|nr:hypothetical protein [Deltaproteobacteria bacterium]